MDNLNNFQHVCAALLLLARLGDNGVAYLVSPHRRMGLCEWLFNLYCLIPYWSLDLGVVMLFPFFMLTISRCKFVWFERVEGQQEYLDRCIRVATQAGFIESILLITMEPLCFVCCGYGLIYFCSMFPHDFANRFGIGIFVWAGITGLHHLRMLIRHRRMGLKTIGTLGSGDAAAHHE